jgi:AraC-like DNA-binding protein
VKGSKGQFQLFRCEAPGVQAIAAATRHSFPRHWHEQYGVGVIHQGAHKSFSGRGMVEAGPGDAITVNPGEVHDGAPIGDDGRSWRMLYFDPAVIADPFSDMNEGGSKLLEFSAPVIADPTLAPLFRRLFYAMTASGEPALDMRREELLLELLARIIRPFEPPASQAPAAIRRAKSLIDDEPAAPLALADLARESGLSRFQVLRGFAKATGFTPHNYLMQRRIDLARRLIAHGARLAEAAATSGFADQSHMTRIFVRKYGVSPGAYAAAFA